MMKKILLTICLPFALALYSCNNETTDQKTETEETTVATEEEEVIEESPVKVYTLTDMIPITGGKVLTKQDIAYIDDSKTRTLNNTELTLNDDGTFTRVFPHPSGDGTIKTWEGTYTIEGETLTFNIEMNGKSNPMEFAILENTDSELSISSSFGQIDMNYVYSIKK